MTPASSTPVNTDFVGSAERLVHKLDACTDAKPNVGPQTDLAILSGPQGLSARTIDQAQGCSDGEVRSHLHASDRLRHPRPPAQTTSRQQSRVAQSARAARNPAPHQRFGKRYSVS